MFRIISHHNVSQGVRFGVISRQEGSQLAFRSLRIETPLSLDSKLDMKQRKLVIDSSSVLLLKSFLHGVCYRV